MFSLPPRLQGTRRSAYFASYLIFAAANAISKQFVSAKTEFVALNDLKTPVRVPEYDDLAMLFDEPNPIHDGAEFWQILELFRLIYGGYIVALFRNGSLVGPGEVPDTMIPYPLTGWTRITPTMYRPNAYATLGWENKSEGLLLENHQCVVKQDPDPSGRFALIAQSDTVEDAALTQTLLDNFTKALLQNSARPGIVVSTEGAMNKDDKQRFLNAWNSQYGGTYNAGKAAILDGGKWTLNEVRPMSISDISSPNFFIESVRKVCMAFGVPELELGLVENVNRASAMVIRGKFLEDTVFPAFRSAERTWKRQFFKRYGIKFQIHFDESSLPSFADILDLRSETVGKLIAASVPRDEAMEILGLRVKPQPWGGQAYLPSTLQPADPEQRAKEKPVPVAPTAAPGEAPKAPGEAPKVDQAKKPTAPPAKAPKPKGKAAHGALSALRAMQVKKYAKVADNAFETCVAPFETPIADGTTKWAKRWKGHFLKRLNHFLKTGQHLDENSRAAKDVSVVIEWKESEDLFLPVRADFPLFMPNKGEATSDLQMRWRVIFGDVQTATEAQMDKELGDIGHWLAAPDKHRQIALDRLGDAIKVDDTIRRQLQDTLFRELDRTPAPKPLQIAQALRTESAHVFKNAFARANTIARTEVSAVMSDYRKGIAKAEECSEKCWSTAKDGCVRETHREAEGEGFIALGAKFKANNLDRPHDPEGSASEVCNCRCVGLYRRGKVNP